MNEFHSVQLFSRRNVLAKEVNELHSERGNSCYANLARLFIARVGLFSLTSLIVVVGMALYGFGLFGSLKSGGFTDPSSEFTRAQALLDSKLGGATADVIVLMSSNTLNANDPAFANAAKSVLATLQARPEVRSVNSYYSTHSAQFISRDGHETFAVVQLAAQDESIKEQDFKTIQPLIASPTLHVTTGGNVAVNVAMNKQVGETWSGPNRSPFPSSRCCS